MSPKDETIDSVSLAIVACAGLLTALCPLCGERGSDLPRVFDEPRLECDWCESRYQIVLRGKSIGGKAIGAGVDRHQTLSS
jgi:hypothetical protein